MVVIMGDRRIEYMNRCEYGCDSEVERVCGGGASSTPTSSSSPWAPDQEA